MRFTTSSRNRPNHGELVRIVREIVDRDLLPKALEAAVTRSKELGG